LRPKGFSYAVENVSKKNFALATSVKSVLDPLFPRARDYHSSRIAIRKAHGLAHVYLRDRVRQRVIPHLGRKDLFAPHLDALVRLLRGGEVAPGRVSVGQLSAFRVWGWAPLLAARHLIGQLALGVILGGRHQHLRHGQVLAERAFVLIAYRLTCPGNELALASWLVGVI
jgi:hypothetical protein